MAGAPDWTNGYADSPYHVFLFCWQSVFHQSEALLKDDLLHPDDLYDRPVFSDDHVDYGQVIPWKLGVLDRSFIRYQHIYSSRIRSEMDEFHSKQSAWLEDFALFMAIKEAMEVSLGQPGEAFARSRPEALSAARQRFDVAIQRQIYRQFIFHRQWSKLRAYAHQNNIQIIGDIPSLWRMTAQMFGHTGTILLG